MPSSERHIKWVKQTTRILSEEYSLNAKVIRNGHLTIYFSDDFGRSCKIRLSTTPSCKSTRDVSITKIRRTIERTFNFRVDKSHFSMQLVQSTGIRNYCSQ